MADKYILKNTRRQAAVKVWGTGSATIDIHELRYLGANSQIDAQSVTPANVELTITDVAFTTRAAGNIVRDGNIILVMPADSADSFNFSNDFGIALNEKANANVVVNLGATEGVCIIQFSKGSGYNDRDLQPLQDWQR